MLDVPFYVMSYVRGRRRHRPTTPRRPRRAPARHRVRDGRHADGAARRRLARARARGLRPPRGLQRAATCGASAGSSRTASSRSRRARVARRQRPAGVRRRDPARRLPARQRDARRRAARAARSRCSTGSWRRSATRCSTSATSWPPIRSRASRGRRRRTSGGVPRARLADARGARRALRADPPRPSDLRWYTVMATGSSACSTSTRAGAARTPTTRTPRSSRFLASAHARPGWSGGRGTLTTEGGAGLSPGIVIGTPWPVGPVNVYVLDDDPLTLIDTGQRSTALADSRPGWRRAGAASRTSSGSSSPTSTSTTAGGAACRRAQRRGAVRARLARDWLERSPASLARRTRSRPRSCAPRRRRRRRARVSTAAGTLRRPGLADAPAARWRRLEFASAASRPAPPGPLALRHRPVRRGGRACCSAATTYSTGRRRRSWLPGQRRRPQRPPARVPQYLASLRATAALELDLILPGHGEPVDDHRATIAARLAATPASPSRPAAAVTSKPRTAARSPPSSRAACLTAPRSSSSARCSATSTS